MLNKIVTSPKRVYISGETPKASAVEGPLSTQGCRSHLLTAFTDNSLEKCAAWMSEPRKQIRKLERRLCCAFLSSWRVWWEKQRRHLSFRCPSESPETSHQWLQDSFLVLISSISSYILNILFPFPPLSALVHAALLCWDHLSSTVYLSILQVPTCFPCSSFKLFLLYYLSPGSCFSDLFVCILN